ncbi:acetate kinase [Paratractidigestivibacter sp.]|uniref:acetate/propionate family kinase n=1 Tax=Paratractidigestivibacter sp. TaxID=2847316 RepID=UPI002ABE314D|nr:acetate kinase [Paratractidigestivibacter sp.]
MKVLAVNAGSSSLKYQLIDSDTTEVLAKGLCERIGIDGHLIAKRGGDTYYHEAPMPTHKEAIEAAFASLTSPEEGVVSSLARIDACGHRVAHGGSFKSSVLVTDETMAEIESLIELAPLHNGPEVTCIKICQELMGADKPQVAAFDTSFHQTMPAEAYSYAVPAEYVKNDRIRRYGFHGTSHRFVAARAAEMMGKPLSDLKIVTCHLGNGSSVTAVDGGKSVDTSMGFTPGAGLPMGTRCGDIDPFIVTHLMNKHNLSASDANSILNKKSGVLAVSGVSSDFRDIEAEADRGNADCQLALDMFAYGVKKLIGAYAAAMGGVDAIVFTAGVGENDGRVREAACKGLEFLGVDFDSEVNAGARGKDTVISKPGSRVQVMVIPTNEELMIVNDVVAIASGKTL